VNAPERVWIWRDGLEDSNLRVTTKEPPSWLIATEYVLANASAARLEAPGQSRCGKGPAESDTRISATPVASSHDRLSIGLCPHGFALADNVCGPCSEGRPSKPADEWAGIKERCEHGVRWEDLCWTCDEGSAARKVVGLGPHLFPDREDSAGPVGVSAYASSAAKSVGPDVTVSAHPGDQRTRSVHRERSQFEQPNCVECGRPVGEHRAHPRGLACPGTTPEAERAKNLERGK
jgi:hypothetical protein